jgi:hypothetical protein
MAVPAQAGRPLVSFVGIGGKAYPSLHTMTADTEVGPPPSRFPAALRGRAARFGLIALVLLFLLYTAFGYWIVPRLVRGNLTELAREQYGRELTVGEIRFNPFTLVLETRDLSFPDADGARLLGYERLMLDFDISSVWKVGASFAAVELQKPFVRVLLRPNGTLNLADLAVVKEPPARDGGESSVGVFIDRLSVSTGSVAFEDRARAIPFATELRPITFELRDFSTGGDSGNAYSLHGASVSGERFAWSGRFALTPLTSSGKFEVAALKATTLWSYLREGLPFEFTKGTLDLNGEYSFAAGEDGGLEFDIHRVGISDFGMRPPGRDYDYLQIAALAFEETRVAMRTRRVDVGRVRLDGGALRVARDAEGRVNLAEFAGGEPAAGGAPPAPPPPTKADAGTGTWVVAAPDIAVSGVRVDFEDRLVKPAASFVLNPVSLAVAGFTTAPASTFDVKLDARGEQTGTLDVALKTGLDTPAYSGRVQVGRFNLAALQPYLATYTQTTLHSGWLDGTLDIAGGEPGAIGARGELAVDKLRLVDSTLGQDLLKWERVAVSGIDYASLPGRLRIARIDARAPYARLVIAQDQTLNISRLFTPAPGTAPAPVQTVRVAEERHAPGGNPGGLQMSIGTVKVTQGSANFADYWIKPNYAVSLQELAGSVSGLSSDPASRARVDLKGRVDRYAPAEIAGQINLLSAALFTDVRVKFDGVEMTSVTPYSGHFAGYAIEKGKLSIDVSYLVENRQLTAKQKFVIDQLQLGDRVESPDAVKLPLKLAVALLKDRNGVIDIDLPMTGSLDDPQFRMGPLIWKAFIGLLTKIATSPFALLAKLGGGDDEINQLDFAAGSAALDAAGQERMTALARALAERPSLELEVPTAYSPEADGEAIARARLDARLPALSGADDATTFDLLRKQCEKELGARAPLPPSAAAVLEQRKKKGETPAYAAANAELLKALLEKSPATEAELGELARARTEAVRGALLGSGEIDARRVFVLGVQPVAAVEGKVRVELALK